MPITHWFAVIAAAAVVAAVVVAVAAAAAVAATTETLAASACVLGHVPIVFYVPLWSNICRPETREEEKKDDRWERNRWGGGLEEVASTFTSDMVSSSVL